ncbi:MAG: hypothetical protein ACLPX9_22065 [Rhodomicrobium sp.]
MGESRETPWRQGSVVPADVAVKLQLFGEEDAPTKVAVVISHDCDLAQGSDAEPEVEIIVGARVSAVNGNYTHAKNARRLHMYLEERVMDIVVDLQATGKVRLRKELLAGHSPDESFRLNAKQHATLQAWLAARYRRAAFPDEFERRLKAAKLADIIAKILKPLGDDIIAVFFDVDEGGDAVEREGPVDPYTLSISLLYGTVRDPAAAADVADKAASQIRSAFNKAFFVAEKNLWQNIELLECEPISDEALTYALSVRMKRWNLDYISLRETPEGAMVV